MQNINSESDLKAAIIELEARRADQEFFLKEQLHQAYESIKPTNLLTGVVTGAVTKLIFQGASKNPLKKILGSVLMFGVTQLVSRNPEIIKSAGEKFFNLFRSKSARKHLASDPQILS